MNHYSEKNTKTIIMKRNLLTIGLLAFSFSANSQVICHVDPTGLFYVGENALVYNGGGVQTKGNGVYDIHGNVMVVGGTSDVLKTLDATDTDGTKLKTSGGNFILRLNDYANYSTSTYGQLYITGLTQGNLSGIVDKEYRATKNGSMQQMALPFYKLQLPDLATYLGAGSFSNDRTTKAVGYWDNGSKPLMHNLPGYTSTLDKASADTQTTQYNNAARYYAVGTANWNPSTPPAAADAYTVKGMPFSDATPINFVLNGAGWNGATPVPYGVGTGTVNNGVYNEFYKTYVQDGFDLSTQGYFNATIGAETGTFGRNIYQFGNPFFTNLDLSTLGYDERSTAGSGSDGNAISAIQGVRYESVGVTTNNTGTHATSHKFITFAANGTPVADYSGAIVKPMQAFVIKLKNNATPSGLNRTLAFNTMRRFAYVTRAVDITGQATNPYSVTGLRNANSNTGTIKQLRVIGLDSNGVEVMRTYYVVGPDQYTGHSTEAKLQVSASSDYLSTREELPTGGEDTQYSNKYWLYINEANQNDFFGKKIRMVADLSKIASYKFEIAENAKEFANGQSTFIDGNESFYIEQTIGNVVPLSHNMLISATSGDVGLYYGKPAVVLGSNDVIKKEQLFVAFEKTSDTHQVIFPKSWKKADITIFDLAGRIIFTQGDINTSSNFILPLKVTGGYLVQVTSEAGEKIVKKIIK